MRVGERPTRVRQTPPDEDASRDRDEREEDTGYELSALRRDGSSE
jgi:hypothetical protein